MKLFSIFGSKQEPQLEPQALPEELEAQETITNEETSNKSNDGNMVTITYGTGMPIDIIYNFLKRSLESEGYKDAFANDNKAYMEKNLSRYRGLLEIKLDQVHLRYECNIRLISQRIESCRENGLFTTMNNLESEKLLYQHHIEKLDKMEKDYHDDKPYMTTFLTSYENGFLRGIAAIAVGAPKPDMSNLKDE